MIADILLVLSCGTLGIFLGTQLAEAILFVPYWKALSADEFFQHHQAFGKKIYRFFAPLTLAATLIPLLTLGYMAITQADNLILFGLMGFSTLAFFSTYFLYFKQANKSFAERSLSDEELPRELERWGNWHWGRICFELIAFGCALLLLVI
ncbi:MAG: hypothetical protein AAF694_02870 [Bacteroidota bacterium]